MHLSTLAARTLGAAFILLPLCGHTLDLHGKALTLYGTFHPSLDYAESDVSRAEADASGDDKLTSGDVSVSFNSSNIGLRGEIATDQPGLMLIYQLEQAIAPDGNSTDTLGPVDTN